MPLAALEADAGVDPDPSHADRLVERHACRIGQRHAGIGVHKALKPEPIQQGVVELSANAAPVVTRVDVDADVH